MLMLASGSAARARLLRSAGVDIEIVRPSVDEAQIKSSFVSDAPDRATALALALAEAKALSIAVSDVELPVVGADQVLQMASGALLDKAATMAELATQLRSMSGASHRLLSAAVIVQAGVVGMRFARAATLTMRVLSDAFIDQYITAAGPALLDCVGGYEIEGLGGQLFSQVDGDPFVIQGLPLLDILGWLQEHKIFPA